MKHGLSFSLVAASIAALLIVGTVPGKAEASPKFIGALSGDGGAGPSFTVCLDAGIGNSATVQLQNKTGTQYCAKFCPTTTCAPSAQCATDFRWNQATVTAQDGGGLVTLNPQPFTTPPIKMGTDRCITALGLDGGDPAVNVFLITGGEGQDYRPQN